MIELKSPSLAINSHDVGYPSMILERTIIAPRALSPSGLVNIIGSVSQFMLIKIAVLNIQIQHRVVHFFVL